MYELFNERTTILLGEPAVEALKKAKVTIIGVGGVGGSCAEALARTGIGTLHIIDPDTVNPSNLNRQAAASKSTLGMLKVEAMKRIIEDVSDAFAIATPLFITPENVASAIGSVTDYIVDACDTVSAKLAIIEYALAEKIPVISSMGAGNRLDPTKTEITDISKTYNCALARIMRHKLKQRGISHLDVVFSSELPRNLSFAQGEERVVASAAFVPNAFGLAIASAVTAKLAAHT